MVRGACLKKYLVTDSMPHIFSYSNKKKRINKIMEALSTMAIIGMENATQTLMSSLGWHFYFQKGS